MNTMRRTTSTPSRALPALLAAVVASIVLGIVGMHALNTHGVTGNTDLSSMASAASVAHGETHGDVSMGSVTSPMTSAHVGMTSSAPGGDDGHSLGTMVMLCFAMLAAAIGALLILFLGLRHRPGVWAQRPAAHSTVTRWLTARLGTGPPYVWNFSVIRC